MWETGTLKPNEMGLALDKTQSDRLSEVTRTLEQTPCQQQSCLGLEICRRLRAKSSKGLLGQKKKLVDERPWSQFLDYGFLAVDWTKSHCQYSGWIDALAIRCPENLSQ